MLYYMLNIRGLIPDDAIHMITPPPSVGTLGRLILDIAIDYYYTTRYFYSFSLTYSTGKTTAR